MKRIIVAAVVASLVATGFAFAVTPAYAQDGGFVVPVVTESYAVPITVGGETFTVTMAIKGSNVVKVTTDGANAVAGKVIRLVSTEPPTEPMTATLVAVIGVPEFPAGEPDEVDVVSVGPYNNSYGATKVGVVIRNNTAKTIYDPSPNAEAYDAEGNLLGFGDSPFIFKPRAVEPGQITVGELWFDGMDVTEEDVIEISVDFSREKDSFREYPLAIQEWGRSSRSDTSIIGVIANRNKVPITTSRIGLVCFDDGNIGQLGDSGETNVESLAPGEEAPFQIVSDCQSFIIYASGYKK